jgi:uncharacterized DUF497 family protein
MAFEWNDKKRLTSLANHGVDFARAADFEWENAVVLPDNRKNYGEPRFRAFGSLDGRPCMIAFTLRKTAVRVISLRWAHMQEIARYVTHKAKQSK